MARLAIFAALLPTAVAINADAGEKKSWRCTENCREEADTMGTLKVSNDAWWGCQTQRSLENFEIGDDAMPRGLIRAFGIQKAAAAEANRKALGDDITNAIIKAAERVQKGEFADQFPLVVYQTGSGTQTNMNVNEVLANLANVNSFGAKEKGTKKPVHPNDHVNKAQSTNDSFPTVMHLAAVISARLNLLPALGVLLESLRKKEKEFAHIIKIGRTHLQDATPITLGQVFSTWARQVELSIERVHSVLERLYLLPQGGTAVGTGLNTEEGFDVKFAEEVNRITGFKEFKASPNKFEGIATHDIFQELAGVQNTIAGSFMKIGNDVRLLGSGPTGGLGELILPANEPGSSIMPGKVNPTQAEAMTMVAAQVMGNAVAVSVANSHGHLELNAFKPVIIYNVMKSTELLADVSRSFAEKCVDGIEANEPKIQEHLDKNLMLVTSLNSKIGYENAAWVAKTALKEGKTLKQVSTTARDGKPALLTEADFDKIVVPANMVAPKKAARSEL